MLVKIAGSLCQQEQYYNHNTPCVSKSLKHALNHRFKARTIKNTNPVIT